LPARIAESFSSGGGVAVGMRTAKLSSAGSTSGVNVQPSAPRPAASASSTAAMIFFIALSFARVPSIDIVMPAKACIQF